MPIGKEWKQRKATNFIDVELKDWLVAPEQIVHEQWCYTPTGKEMGTENT